MRDEEVIQGLIDEIVSVLTVDPMPLVANVLPSVSAEDLVFRDTLGQLPAVGVADTSCDVQDAIGIAQKRQRATVVFELSIAVQDESSACSGRETARRIWGEVNKRLNFCNSAVSHVLGRYRFTGYVYPDHPRPELQLLTARYRIDTVLGNECKQGSIRPRRQPSGARWTKQAIGSIDSQLESMKTWDRSFSGTMSAAETAFQKAAASNLSSPEDISKAANEAIQAVQNIFEGLKATIQAARSEITAIETLQKSAREFLDPSDARQTANIAIEKRAQAVREAVQSLVDGLRQTVDAAKAAKANIESLASRMTDWAKGPEELLADAKTSALSAGLELGKDDLTADQITKWTNLAVTSVEKTFAILMEKVGALAQAMQQIDSLLSGLDARVAEALGETADQKLERLRLQANGPQFSSSRTPDEISKAATDANSLDCPRLM